MRKVKQKTKSKKKKGKRRKLECGRIGLRSGKSVYMLVVRESHTNTTKIRYKNNYVLYCCGVKAQLWLSTETVFYEIQLCKISVSVAASVHSS